MKRNNTIAFTTTALLIGAMVGCAGSQPRADKGSDQTLRRLERYLTGSFSSARQARTDPEYYEIVLHMVPIWEDRNDGPWLYVEQAVAQSSDRPYRQRVYHLTREGATYLSEVYTFEDPMSFAGAYSEPARFDALGPDDLTLRDGCAIALTYDHENDAFVGSTNEDDCASTLRGAVYATSSVILDDDELLSWDRGFDENDQQVWGAVKGGYLFERTD